MKKHGFIVLFTGLLVEQVTCIVFDGEIGVSLAVYNDILVVGTTGKDTRKSKWNTD